MNKSKLIYLASTLLIAIPMFVNGILEIMQPNDFLTEALKLGYPLYFFKWLGVAKIIGAVLLALPKIPFKLKELGYAGFFFDFIFAFISLATLGEFPKAFAPLLFLFILGISYKYKQKKTFKK